MLIMEELFQTLALYLDYREIQLKKDELSAKNYGKSASDAW